MSNVLEDAEQRIAPAAATAQTIQRERIQAMREEIGPQHYVQAQVELPKLEQVIAKDIRPFLEYLVRISQQAKTPLPPSVLDRVRELQELCESGARWVREGIDEWERLTPPLVRNTQQLDTGRRGTEVASLRTKLMNWDGKRSRLRDLRANIEQYIQESGWPAAQPVNT
jgi:hypothetical protein